MFVFTKIWRFLVNFLLQERAGQWWELCSGAVGWGWGASSDREETPHGHPCEQGMAPKCPALTEQ